MIGNAGGKTPIDIVEPAGLPQQHGAAIGCHLSTVEGTDNPASPEGFKLALFRFTLCLLGVGLPHLCMSL